MSEANEKVMSILKKPLLCAEWTTVVPGKNKESLSPKFYLKSIQFHFKLGRSWDGLYLNLIRMDNLDFTECFKCTVIVDQEDDLKLPAPSIRKHFDVYRTRIWKLKTSDVELDRILGKPISFLVVLEADGGPAREEEGSDWFENLDKSLHSLTRDFAKLQDDASNADIKLLCGDLTIPAHGNILRVRSQVFEKMLETDMVEKRTGSIEIPDIQPEVLKEFLRYIYSGTLPEMTVDKALQLYEAGDKYNVQSLVEECASYLGSSLNEDNVCDILALADDHSDPKLKERAICFISQEEIPLEGSDTWKNFSNQRPDLALEAMERLCKDLKRFCPE